MKVTRVYNDDDILMVVPGFVVIYDAFTDCMTEYARQPDGSLTNPLTGAILGAWEGEE
jgi:hypothetical protein